MHVLPPKTDPGSVLGGGDIVYLFWGARGCCKRDDYSKFGIEYKCRHIGEVSAIGPNGKYFTATLCTGHVEKKNSHTAE